MSQYDFGDLESPLSGNALINTHLEPWRNALHSNHSGNSRPSYAAAGMIWVETDATPWNIWMFDGSDDILLGTLDTTNNMFTPSGSLIYNWCGTSGGTANAQTFTPDRAITAYATGQAFEGVISTPNTAAAPTINISGVGAKTVKIYGPGGKVNLPVGALQGICRFVYDGTDLILLNVRPYNKAASIATASTVNLDNATGDFVHLTGTTTVTAFTLAEGQQKVCVADGAFTIDDGTGDSPQGIICPGAANITTAAGDVFIIRGEGSGTTRIVSYTKADGTPVVSAGGGGALPAATLPAANYIFPIGFSAIDTSSGFTVTANRLYGMPIAVGEETTIDRISIYVVSGSGNARLGIYEISGDKPGALLYDEGAVDVSTAGSKSITISRTLPAGLYYLGLVFSGTPSVAKSNGGSADDPINALCTLVFGGHGLASYGHCGVYVAHTYGALPDPFGSATEVYNPQSLPWIGVRVS